ncbi:MAG TPA: ShlB/FhaC/HecB family hemolysin secretion/activation protein, partial [Eoetvoesiella sp.]
MHSKLCLSTITLALMASSCAGAQSLPAVSAQSLPDAGRILQEMPIPQQQLPASVDVDVDSPAIKTHEKVGGAKVRLNAVSFKGAGKFTDDVLQDLVASSLGKALDLDELRELGRKVTVFYRDHGYPFARAYLPAQRMAGGKLIIEVIEGQYGKVAATAGEDAKLAEQAQPFLSSLKTGDVIESAPLERAVLTLSDLPGVAVRPVIRPGEQVGTGDLNVQTTRTKSVEGKVTLDNYGNRYSGRNRLTVQGNWNSPFMLGDQLNVAVMATDEKLYFGSIGYSLPLGTSGLRGDVGFAKSSYELGQEFAVLGATGTAQVSTVGLSYPILRSNKANVLIAAHYQHKDLVDEYTSLNIRNEKSSNSVPIALQFDVRDSLLGGGITYGGVTLTAGEVSLDTPSLREQDDVTARTAGSFTKLNMDLARLQALPGNFNLFGRVLGQWTKSNLDSSERFSLGGIDGVRAYPLGEGSGDQGVLAQVELRYNAGMFTPYAFWDTGKVKINRNPWTSGENHRSLSGGGVGVR